jgi:hypothetical protein
MARLMVGAVFGVLVGVVVGAALDLSAEPNEDVVQAAEMAGVDPVRLEEALVTVGESDPKRYLYNSGELAPPRPVLGATPSSIWDRLAACESGGNWHIDAYHDGGLQFLPSTWLAYGGGQYARYAYLASREQQIAIAQKVQAAAGWGQWPVCSRRLGLR